MNLEHLNNQNASNNRTYWCMFAIKEGHLPSHTINLGDQPELPDVVVVYIVQVAVRVSSDSHMISGSINPLKGRER